MDLFDYCEQQQQLKRVSSKIARSVLDFAAEQGYSAIWHASDLHAFVSDRCGGAPGSADRVLRELRKRGHLNYIVINRAQSLYRFTEVRTHEVLDD